MRNSGLTNSYSGNIAELFVTSRLDACPFALGHSRRAPDPSRDGGCRSLRRARQSGIPGDSLTVAEIARQDFANEHVGRLHANADDARDQANHRGRPWLGVGGCSELPQTILLDFLDLIEDDPQPRHVAPSSEIPLSLARRKAATLSSVSVGAGAASGGTGARQAAEVRATNSP